MNDCRRTQQRLDRAEGGSNSDTTYDCVGSERAGKKGVDK